MILGMTVGSLVNYLKTQSEKGVSHVYLSQAARDAVRSAIKANKPQPKESVAQGWLKCLERAKEPLLSCVTNECA